MKDELEGVLECVRVMEINSEVFAKEVEPTGLLPMEMTLARLVSNHIGEVTRPPIACNHVSD